MLQPSTSSSWVAGKYEQAPPDASTTQALGAAGAGHLLSQSGFRPCYSSNLTPLIKGRPDGTFLLYSRYSSPKK